MIKEYLYIKGASFQRVVVRNDNYASSLGAIMKLVDEARKDFPDNNDLTDNQIDIAVYDGRCYKRCMGIEFTVDAGVTIPDDYTEVIQLISRFA